MQFTWYILTALLACQTVNDDLPWSAPISQLEIKLLLLTPSTNNSLIKQSPCNDWTSTHKRTARYLFENWQRIYYHYVRLEIMDVGVCYSKRLHWDIQIEYTLEQYIVFE